MEELEQNIKELNSKERLYAKKFEDIWADHRERYTFALKFINKGDLLLDGACGIGYGTCYMAVNSECSRVFGLDISDHALGWAKKYFSHEKVTFLKADFAEELPESISSLEFDVVTCFETLEHIKDDKEFIKRLRRVLKPGGYMLVSAPNELKVPFLKNPYFENGINPFHFRHYTPEELRELLTSCGFYICGVYTQVDSRVEEGDKGDVNVLVCEKSG